MKRHFIKKPILASTSFWSTDVNSEEDIKAEIQKALDAGTTFEDIDDYLNELYNLGILNDEEVSELLNWAAPYTSNGDVYASEDTGSKRARFEVGSTYRGSSLYGGQITYKVVSRTATTVSLAESHISEDDYSEVNDGVTEYPIVMEDMYDSDYDNVIGKQEAVVTWEYLGHAGYLFANDNKVGYDEVEGVYAAKHVDTGIEIDFPGKKTFDTLEEAQAFKRTLGDRYLRMWKSEYPDCTLYTVDFKPEDDEEPEYYDEEDEEYDEEYMNAYEEYEEDSRRRDRTPSSTAGDYSPSNPWDAPGMSMRDFI